MTKSPCIGFCEDAAPDSFRFNWCEDTNNTEGKSQSHKFNGVKEWNPENAKWKTGKLERTSCFAASIRGQFDSTLERDDGFRFKVALDKFRAGDTRGAFSASIGINIFSALASGPLGSAIRSLVCTIQEDCLPIFSGDTTSCIQLVVLDGTPERATIVKRKTGRQVDGCDIYEYNYPLSMSCLDRVSETYVDGQLYTEFYSIEDPNNGCRPIYEIKDFEWKYSCEEFMRFYDGGQCGWWVDTPWGRANIDSVKMSRGDQTASLNLGKVRCKTGL